MVSKGVFDSNKKEPKVVLKVAPKLSTFFYILTSALFNKYFVL